GILLSKVPKFADRFISFVGILQTIPSLAILAFFIPIVGIGKVPAILALFFYSLLPILRNTHIGLRGVDQGLVEAGIGMGMSGWQERVRMKLPLAVLMISAGIRLSAVYVIGWAALAAFSGGGGLGYLSFAGRNLYAPSLILAGTIPAAIMAVIAGRAFALRE